MCHTIPSTSHTTQVVSDTTKVVWNKRAGVFHMTKGVWNKSAGVFHMTKGVWNKRAGVFHMTKGVWNKSGVMKVTSWVVSFVIRVVWGMKKVVSGTQGLPMVGSLTFNAMEKPLQGVAAPPPVASHCAHVTAP